MRRALIVVTGLLLAFLAALTGLGLGLLAEATAIGAWTSVAVLVVASTLGEREWSAVLAQGVPVLWGGTIAVCLAPVAVAATIGEAARLRDPIWYAGVTGALSAAVPTVLRVILDMPAVHDVAREEIRLTLLLLLTGMGAGFVYWAAAGRQAGVQ